MALPDKTIFSNGISIPFVWQNENYSGLGAVSANGVTLRSAARPMFVEIRNPWGVQLLDYRLQNYSGDNSGVRLTFTASREQKGIMEWMAQNSFATRIRSQV